MQITAMVMPVGFLIVMAVIVGLVMLVRALPPGSGPKVALGVGGLIVLLTMFFVAVDRPTLVRHDAQVVQEHPAHFGTFPATDLQQPAASVMPTFERLLLILIGLAVLVGLVCLIYFLAQSSGGRVTLGAGGLVVMLLVFMSFFYLSKGQMMERQVAVRQELRSTGGSGWQDDPADQFQVKPPRISENRPAIEPNKERESLISTPSEASVSEPEPKAFTTDTNAEKPNGKPAWLTQGTQTGNGVSRFPVSSELFATVAECQKDLDGRMPALIAAEAQYIVGEEYPILLLPGEAQGLVAETFLEEFPITSNGTWYKIHRLIKIDQLAWDTFHQRFQQAQLHARLVSLGYGFGGLMLVLGVVYLILRRTPRVVDPTLNTFSTT